MWWNSVAFNVNFSLCSPILQLADSPLVPKWFTIDLNRSKSNWLDRIKSNWSEVWVEVWVDPLTVNPTDPLVVNLSQFPWSPLKSNHLKSIHLIRSSRSQSTSIHLESTWCDPADPSVANLDQAHTSKLGISKNFPILSGLSSVLKLTTFFHCL